MKERIFMLLLTLSISSLSCLGQNTDSLEVATEMKEAFKLLNESKFEESIMRYEQVKRKAFKYAIWDMGFDCENIIIEALWRQYKLEEALSRAKNVLPRIKGKLGDDSFNEGNIYNDIATIHLLDGVYDSAILYYKKSIAIKKKHGKRSLEGISASYSNIGAVYTQLGDLKKAGEYFQKSLEIDEEWYKDDPLNLAYSYSNMAGNLMDRSLFDVAFVYLKKAVSIFEVSNTRGIPYNKTLLNLATCYQSNLEFQKSYDHISRALTNSKALFGESSIHHTEYYKWLGAHFQAQWELDSSEYYFAKALEYDDEMSKLDPYNSILLWNQMALCQGSLGKTSEALKSIERARIISRRSSVEGQNNLTVNYVLGEIYMTAHNYPEAKKYFLKAIEVKKAEFGEKHVILSSLYRNVSQVLTKQNEYTEALEYIQKSLTANKGWDYSNLYDNPSFEGVHEKTNFLFSLQEKAFILGLRYAKSNDLKDLQGLLDTYDAMDKTIRGIPKSFSELKDKHQFQSIKNDIYKNAITQHFRAYQITKDETHLHKCFYYTEASKSGALSDAINSLDARGWSNIPEEILVLEEQFKVDIAQYQSLINEEKLGGGNIADSTKNLSYQSEMFDAKFSLDSLYNIIKLDYPSYYQIKYQNDFLTVNEIQNQLEEGTSLIEYFLGDSASYAFLITKTDFVVKEIANLGKLSKMVNEFRSEINLSEKTDWNGTMTALEDKGYRLFSELIEPLLNNVDYSVTNKLIIIPDSELGYLPFESFLVNKPGQKDKKSFENYLIQKFAISYHYSATLQFQKNLNRESALTYASFAPIYANDTLTNDDKKSLGRFRNALTPLEWNQAEAEALAVFMKGDPYLGANATEAAFKKRAKSTKVLHLAMHAFIDDEEPMNSKLVFYQDNDSIEDGYLHTFELYNMQLNADLAVLSACETGYGKLQKGEGVVSLARGFAYAGVPSVVMSHWQVDDESTSILMQHFYKNLADGLSKSEALRQAKLNYLEEASPNKQHPFFWGGFVVIGDDSPIIQKSNHWWVYVGVGLAVLAILALIFVRKKRAN